MKVLSENAVAVRTKAMKCLTAVIEADPGVLARVSTIIIIPEGRLALPVKYIFCSLPALQWMFPKIFNLYKLAVSRVQRENIEQYWFITEFYSSQGTY